MAVRRIAEQADRAGKVIKQRARLRAPARPHARGGRAAGAARCGAAAGAAAGAQARRCASRSAAEERLPRVLCDRTMVEQVLLNLARNAHAGDGPAGPDERVLRLRAVRARAVGEPAMQPTGRSGAGSSSRWPIVGSGISEEVAQRLFTPFFTTRAEGMGLGLSLCRTVVEQHGGALGVRAATGRAAPCSALPFRRPDATASRLMQPADRCPRSSSSTTTPACARRWPGCCARAAC